MREGPSYQKAANVSSETSRPMYYDLPGRALPFVSVKPNWREPWRGAFSVIARLLWNSLPHEARLAPLLRSFRCIVKMGLFWQAFHFRGCPFLNSFHYVFRLYVLCLNCFRYLQCFVILWFLNNCNYNNFIIIFFYDVSYFRKLHWGHRQATKGRT